MDRDRTVDKVMRRACEILEFSARSIVIDGDHPITYSISIIRVFVEEESKAYNSSPQCTLRKFTIV